MRGVIKEFLFIQPTLYLPSLFETYLNKANYIIYEKLSRVFSVVKSSTSNRPLFSCTESPYNM